MKFSDFVYALAFRLFSPFVCGCPESWTLFLRSISTEKKAQALEGEAAGHALLFPLLRINVPSMDQSPTNNLS